VPEDLKQAKLVSLASLRKVKFLGTDCDLVVYDDEVWAFKYSADSEDLGQILEQIRRLERLGACGATHFVPLHAIILDSYNHFRGFIMPYQAGGSLVQFHKAGLQAAQAEGPGPAEPPAGSVIQKSGDKPQSIQSPLQVLVWHDSTRLFWATQLAKAVAEMHQLDMVHGDIKPENTVIDKNGRLLIIDVYCDGFTKDFAAPEVLAHPGEPKFMSKQHDVYCVGMSIMAILEERPNLSPPTFPLTWNPDGRTPLSLRKLIMQCLCSNPEDRPSIRHIVSALECACRSWIAT
jgi:serine/threonine protein kinase